MLLKSYTLEVSLPRCNRSLTTLNAIAELSDDVSEVMPYINAIIKGCTYQPELKFLRFVKDGRVINLHPKRLAAGGFRDEAEARQVLDSVKEFINITFERRGEIVPSYRRGDELKPLEVLKLLPGTNCKKCGQPTCFAFMTRLLKQQAKIADCTPLFSGEYDEKSAKLLILLEKAGFEVTPL